MDDNKDSDNWIRDDDDVFIKISCIDTIKIGITNCVESHPRTPILIITLIGKSEKRYVSNSDRAERLLKKINNDELLKLYKLTTEIFPVTKTVLKSNS